MSIWKDGKNYGATQVINYSAAPDYNRGVAVTNIQSGTYRTTDNGFLMIEVKSTQSNPTKVSVIRSKEPITTNTGMEIASKILMQYQYSETLTAQVMAGEYYKLLIDGAGNPTVISVMFYPYASTVPMKLTANIEMEQVDGLNEELDSKAASNHNHDLANQSITGVLPLNKGGLGLDFGAKRILNQTEFFNKFNLTNPTTTQDMINAVISKTSTTYELTVYGVTQSVITDLPVNTTYNLHILRGNSNRLDMTLTTVTYIKAYKGIYQNSVFSGWIEQPTSNTQQTLNYLPVIQGSYLHIDLNKATNGLIITQNNYLENKPDSTIFNSGAPIILTVLQNSETFDNPNAYCYNKQYCISRSGLSVAYRVCRKGAATDKVVMTEWKPIITYKGLLSRNLGGLGSVISNSDGRGILWIDLGSTATDLNSILNAGYYKCTNWKNYPTNASNSNQGLLYNFRWTGTYSQGWGYQEYITPIGQIWYRWQNNGAYSAWQLIQSFGNYHRPVLAVASEQIKESKAGTDIKIWVGTQAEYNALASKDANTLYFCS